MRPARYLSIFLPIAFSLVITLPSQAMPSGETASADKALSGEALYQQYCSQCHEGNVPRAPHNILFRMSAAEDILAAMNDGVMQAQSADLSTAQRVLVANYLSGNEVSEKTSKPILACGPDKPLTTVSQADGITGWGVDARNSRMIPIGMSGLSKDNVGTLNLKWAFAYPGATRARSQPAIYNDVIYVGSQHGNVYALDLETGCAHWSYRAKAEVRSGLSIDDTGPALKVYFGDIRGNVYALDALTGGEIWRSHLNDHKDAIITGSPKLHKNRLYVPISSNEWASAADPTYECCTFRGGIAAFDTASGDMIWKTHSIPEVAKDTGKRNPLDVPILAPSGVPIWNSPTIDEKRQLIYVGTGESYTSPAAPTSDAVLAFRMADGKMVWHKQLLAGDAWNMSCFIGSNYNCPEEDGPDMDIGASVILISDAAKGDIIVVGQKNGVVHGLNPDKGGDIVWQRKIGVGGYAGGVHWGMAAIGELILAPNADTDFIGRYKDEDRRPGIYAINAFSGEQLWYTRAEEECRAEEKPACDAGLSAAVTATDGIVFAGAFDGQLRAFDVKSGKVVWRYNTNRAYNSLSGHAAHGGSIESDGPVLYKGHLIVNSGYLYGSRMPGNVLLNFSID